MFTPPVDVVTYHIALSIVMNLCASVAQPMLHLNLMKVALVTSHGRMAPCFGGVELGVVDDDADLRDARVLSTHGWHPLAWGRELMRRDVTLLMCAGIDQATWAAVQGHGIQVIPNAIGDPKTVFATWRSGQLSPPQLWPAYPVGFGGRRGLGTGRRKRFHGGRG